MKERSYYSNGKILLTGEYLVLHGALALCLPLKFGQSLTISKKENNKEALLYWKSFALDKLWFSLKADISTFQIIETSHRGIAEKLLQLIGAAKSLNTTFLDKAVTHEVISRANFSMEWGLGSSSSLISNVAYWSHVDPFQLHRKVSHGSGYDIACARINQPLLYKRHGNATEIQKIDFHPSFSSHLYFVYSGAKQDTEKSILNFHSHSTPCDKDIGRISDITNNMLKAASLHEFDALIEEHEQYMAGILKKDSIQKLYFSDFDGQIKSLGAWGGDFLLASWKGTKTELLNYFAKKNLGVIFGYDEIILKP